MKNMFVQNFVSELQGRYGMLEKGVSDADWICKNTKLLGRNFSLKGHEFQQAIINDNSQHVVVKKCSQVGLTEIIVRKTLAFLVRNQGTTAIMTQPTRAAALAFSTTRVNDIITESPSMHNLLNKKVDAKELKQLGKSYMYIKGTIGAASAISVPADMIITDEFDFSDLAVVGKYNSRLSHSKYKLIRRFSTPTIPDFAISKEFNLSTQNHFLMKCPKCNHWNNHDFFKDVVVTHPRFTDVKPEDIVMDDLVDIGPDQVKMLCQKCRQPLEYHDYTKMDWVAKHPGRYISGYQVRPWNTATQRPFDLLRSREDYELYSDWVNFGLGEDYIDANQIFDHEKIMQGSFKPAASYGLFLGIDFGKDTWLTAGFETPEGEIVLCLAEKVSEHKIKARVQELIRNYFVVGMVLDALPQTKLASDIRDLMPGRAYTCYYSDNQKDYYALKANEQDVTVNRTQLYDKVLAVKGLHVDGDINIVQLKEHLHGMVKQRLSDLEVEAVRYVKVKADHLLHSLGYLKLANDIFGDSTVHTAPVDIGITTFK